MKGHMENGKFHPHTEYKKGTRKSRDQKEKTQGIKFKERKAREATLDELIACRQEAFKCKGFREAEKFYLDGFTPKYTKSDEIISELEDNDVDVSQYQTEESKIEQEEHDKLGIRLREEHLKTCNEDVCRKYYESLKSRGNIS